MSSIVGQSARWSAPGCKQQGVIVNNRRRLGWDTIIAGKKGENGVLETHRHKGDAGGTHRRSRAESEMGAWGQTQCRLENWLTNAEQRLQRPRELGTCKTMA